MKKATLSRTLSVLRPGAPMFIIGALLSTLVVTLDVVGFDSDLVASNVAAWIAHRGLWIVFLAYILEGLFVVNFYWPGSFVLFAAAVGCSEVSDFVLLWLLANLAAGLSLSLDYAMGRYGAYRLLLRLWSADYFGRVGEWTAQRGRLGFILVGFHINWLALLTTFTGATRKRSFLDTIPWALLSHALWSIPLIVTASLVGKGIVASNQTNWIILDSFFLIGFALCVLEAVREARARVKLSNAAFEARDGC